MEKSLPVVVKAALTVESLSAEEIPMSGIISGGLRDVAPPLPFVMIAGGWPSGLIGLLALKLPIQSPFYLTKFHWYFKPS